MNRGRVLDLHASKRPTELTGESIGTNILMLGYATQKELLPLSMSSIQEVIRLNGSSHAWPDYQTGNSLEVCR